MSALAKRIGPALQVPQPVQLQINQTGSWRSVLDFDFESARPALLVRADQMVVLAGTRGSLIRMRVMRCRPNGNGGYAATGEVVMTWTARQGWVSP